MWNDYSEIDDYWMNFGKIYIKDNEGKTKKTTNLPDFLKYSGKDEKTCIPKSKKIKAKRGRK